MLPRGIGLTGQMVATIVEESATAGEESILEQWDLI
jgi:hypothetical protein